MAVVQRAEDAPAGSRIDHWREVVADTLVPLGMSTDLPGDYSGRLAHTDLGAMQFVELTAAPLHVWRTPELIRRSDPGLYKIEMHTRGHSLLAQGNRESVLRAGDVALVDTSRPYRMAAGYPAEPAAPPPRTALPQLVTLMVPRPMLPLRARATSDVAGLGVSDRLSTGGLVAAALGQLARRIGRRDDPAAARLAGVVVDLLAIGLADDPEPACALASGGHGDALFWQMQEFIDNHLGDAGLSPGVVAAAHHVSLRHMHRLFAARGTTVSELVRSRRLDRCRRELTDPALRGRPVAAVGARWGFAGAAQFNRAFRQAYGMPPAAYRRHQLQDPPGA